MRDILLGHARQMARKILMARLQTVRNILLWLCFLHHIAGGMEKAFLHMKKKQKSCFAPAFIKEKMADQESLCGIVKTSKFYLCQAQHLPIRPIIFLIFMSCLQNGRMRKIGHFGQRQQR